MVEHLLGQGAGLDVFGYFHTESSHHASEYVPWFRKNPALVQGFIPERWDYYQICLAHDEEGLEKLLERLKAELKPSLEYGSWIIEATQSGTPRVVYGNVPNKGLITNLPEGCCVEQVSIEDGFWAPRQKVNREKSIAYQFAQLERIGAIEALDVQPRPLKMTFRPSGVNYQMFWDSDIAKWLEAAFYMTTHPDAKLEAQVEEIIAGPNAGLVALKRPHRVLP